MLVFPADYDAIEVIEGYPDGWEFVAAYGRDGQTVAVLATIPNRVYGCRDAIAERAEFPPRRPGSRLCSDSRKGREGDGSYGGLSEGPQFWEWIGGVCVWRRP
jgi:hypothetical protein